MAQTPAQQHATQAQKIMARRATKQAQEVKLPVVDTVAPVEREPVAPAPVLTIKELRKVCDAQGIAYKKKDTLAQLTEKLNV